MAYLVFQGCSALKPGLVKLLPNEKEGCTVASMATITDYQEVQRSKHLGKSLIMFVVSRVVHNHERSF